MLASSFLAGMTTSRVAAFQSKVGVGLVRSQPFHFPSSARTRLGDKNQYETEAISAPVCGARITHRSTGRWHERFTARLGRNGTDSAGGPRVSDSLALRLGFARNLRGIGGDVFVPLRMEEVEHRTRSGSGLDPNAPAQPFDGRAANSQTDPGAGLFHAMETAKYTENIFE